MPSIKPRMVAIVACLVLFGMSQAASADDFFPDSSTTYVSPSDLQDLDCYGLWHARNEIFARNGYHFRTARGQAEFGTSGWTSNPKLNGYETRNVSAIQQAERANGCR